MKKSQYRAIYIAWFLLMMMLGSVYTYSIYRPVVETEYQISVTLSGLPYMLSLASYALSMYVTGKALKKTSIKRMILMGGILFTSAWMGASLSQSFVGFTLFYGLIMGVAVGILYGAALEFVQRYTQANTGFFIGWMLLGFGLSSVVLSPLASWVIQEQSMAILFMGFALVSGLILIPLYGLYPNDSMRQETLSTSSSDALRLLMLFTVATMIGLTMIGLTNVIATNDYGFTPLNVAWAISVFALLNGVSRPIFGWAFDRFGFKKSAFLSVGLMAIASTINLLNQGSIWVLFLMGYGLYWFNLGAWLSLMPNYIKTRVGVKNYAPLYGKVFLGYGISAIIGTLISSVLLDLLGGARDVYILDRKSTRLNSSHYS